MANPVDVGEQGNRRAIPAHAIPEVAEAYRYLEGNLPDDNRSDEAYVRDIMVKNAARAVREAKELKHKQESRTEASQIRQETIDWEPEDPEPPEPTE